MKKRFFIYSVLAALLMTGCSKSEEDLLLNEEAVNGEAVNGENGENGGESTTSYLTVNLMSADDAAGARTTRAATNYEDGSLIENEITKIRFYFFTESGAPANVKLLGNNYVNYYDYAPDDQEQDGNNNDDIESHLKQATIVINTKNGDKLPQLMAAVLNPTETIVQSRSLEELKNLVNDYAKAELTKKGKFVMFNAVYATPRNNPTTEVCAVSIKEENLAKSEKSAKETPVNIYVERNVAKVSVDLGSDLAKATTGGKLLLKDRDGNEIKVNGQNVYLQLGGWDLTAETSNGRLGKEIDTQWSDAWRWGSHRSFWAINSPSAKNTYIHNYNTIETAIGTHLYTNENAEDYTINNETNDLNRTKVILKGTLCKADGTAFTIVRHLGAHFADTYSENELENLPELKKNILSQLSVYRSYYYDTTNEKGEPIRKQIAPEDLRIENPQVKEENSQTNCYVYTQLTDIAAGKIWYDGEDENAERVTSETINSDLGGEKAIVDPALVWNGGMTYYYYEIIHNGSGENATKGVVRNHVYRTTVTSIAGLGTPVYAPKEVIYPEKPDPNDHYIAAQINILSWRIVANNYDLEW